MVNSVVYHPCPWRLASQGYIFLYFFKLRRVLSLQNTCWIFSDFYISRCVGKIFQSMVFFTFLENHWIYAFLLISCSPTQTSWIFWKFVLPKTEEVEVAIICSAKIQSENMKMTWNISLFSFGMIAIFLNAMALQFCK